MRQLNKKFASLWVYASAAVSVSEDDVRALASPERFRRLAPEQMATLVRSGARAPGNLLERFLVFLMLGRPRTCVPGLLGYALGFSYAGAPFSGRVLLAGFLSFLIGFSANLHNAYTDVEEDSRNLPGRVFLLAKLGYRALFWMLVAISFFMVGAAIVLGPYFIIFMALAAVGLHQYSFPPFRMKEHPVLGLWVFAQAVVFPFLFGFATEPAAMHQALLALLGMSTAGGIAPSPELVFLSHRYLGMLIFLTLWFMAKGAYKNVPDFYGDRAAGIRTSATVCGTWRRAALVATVATVAAYLSLAILVGLGLESRRLLYALVWLVPVAWNCCRLLRADEGTKGNQCLKVDMLLSSGFIGTVLLLVSPRWESLAVVALGALILFGSDFLSIDSRRKEDVPARATD